MSKSAIEQADEIVGIAEELSTNEITRAFNPDTYRRGAYVEWMPKQKGFHGLDAPLASDPIEDLAAYIVKLHAASKPKGDGLPERISFSTRSEGGGTPNGERKFSIEFDEPMNGKERDAVAFYFMRCIAPPVRRLLAAFDVVEPTSEQKLSGEAFVVSTHTAACLHGNSGEVCWLVPKGAK